MNNPRKRLKYHFAQKHVPSPHCIIDILCDNGYDQYMSPLEILSAAHEIRDITIKQLCLDPRAIWTKTEEDVEKAIDIASMFYFKAQAKTKWGLAVDNLHSEYIKWINS